MLETEEFYFVLKASCLFANVTDQVSFVTQHVVMSNLQFADTFYNLNKMSVKGPLLLLTARGEVLEDGSVWDIA